MIITRVPLSPIVLQITGLQKNGFKIPEFPLVHFWLHVISNQYKEHSEVTLVKLPLATTRVPVKATDEGSHFSFRNGSCYKEAVLIRTQWPTLMTTRSSPCSQIPQNPPMVDYRKDKSLKHYLVRPRISSL